MAIGCNSKANINGIITVKIKIFFPNAIKIFSSKQRSYKDLPLRFSDIDVIHRNEKSGQLNGLFRVRTFTQDDAHIFMTADQIESEVVRLIAFIDRVYSILNLPYDMVDVNVHPTKMEVRFSDDKKIYSAVFFKMFR